MATAATAADATSADPPSNVVYKQGWLEKRGDLRKNWKRRHFVLKDNTLKYYKKPSDSKPQGEIPLEGCGVDFVPEEKYNKRYCFELHTTVAKKRIYVLVSESGPDMQEWLTEIRKAVLRIRKEKSRGTKDKGTMRRVTQLLEEQDAEAMRRVSRENLSLPSTADSSTSSIAPGKPVEMETVEPGKRTRAPSMPYDEEKMNQYMDFLHETSNYQRRGTISEPPPYYQMQDKEPLISPRQRREEQGRRNTEWWNQPCNNCNKCSLM